MIRKLVTLGLLLSLVAPLIAVDHAPFDCTMGGTATAGEAAPAVHHLHHPLTHVASTLSRRPESPSGKQHHSHNCVCPWECGSSRGPADQVLPARNVNIAETRTASVFQIHLEPGTTVDARLPLTTGPPGSLRG